MFIRYYVVRNIAAVALVGGLFTWIAMTAGPAGPTEPAATSRPVAAPSRSTPAPRPVAARPVAARPVTATAQPAVRPVAAVPERPWASIITAGDARARSAKAKDVFRGTGPKVNLYDDNADGRYDRGKVDWNRDGAWDAKLTRKSGAWEVSEGGRVAVWDAIAGRMVAKDAAARVPQARRVGPRPVAPRPAKAAAVPGAVDQPAAYAAAGARMRDGQASGKKAKDAMRSTGAKVNLYDDNGDGRWDRAKVDVDRDGSWDGKLTAKNGAVELKVSGRVYLLRDTSWVPKKR